MVGIRPLLRRSDANSRSNVRPATGVPDHRAANSEKEAKIFQIHFSRNFPPAKIKCYTVCFVVTNWIVRVYLHLYLLYFWFVPST